MLAVPALLGAASIGVWHSLRTDEPPQPYQRQLTEVELRWRCPNGHLFYALGAAEPRTCPECNAEAMLVDVYACPDHGLFEVGVLLDQTSDARRPHVSHVRLPGGNWVPIETGLRCPRCGKLLTREILVPRDDDDGD